MPYGKGGRGRGASQKTCQTGFYTPSRIGKKTAMATKEKETETQYRNTPTLRRAAAFLLGVLSCVVPVAAQDTSHVRVTLPEVVITEKNARPNSTLTQTPTQVVEVERLERLGSIYAADALRQMAGATLKDYGGVGGIKTVSVRGMGSQFSTLTIDGVAVNDCQNGQVDLSRYSLGNTSFFTLSNGQSATALQSARAYAAGSVMSMETHEPEFDSLPWNLRAGLEGGSFGYLSPTLNVEHRLGSKGSIALWGNYMRSDGDYPFTLYYTGSKEDSSSRERRENSAVRTGTVDANLFYNFAPRKRLQVKAHYMQGYHQLPGPVIYYRVAESGEHTEEKLFFAQARYRQTGNRWDWQLTGKYQYSNDFYEDTANTAGHILNLYTQREAYLSQGCRFHTGDDVRDYLSVTAAVDESLSRLLSNLPTHNDVTRESLQGVLTAQYEVHLWEWLRGLTFNTHILGTFIRDRKPAPAPSGTPYLHASPYLGATLTRGMFTFRAFFKDTYRVPNFNELYYFTVGRALRPERGRQYNAGISFHSGTQKVSARAQGLRHRIEATVDVYRNRVSDKIIAVPTQNMFIWSMRNLGEVEITGLDVTGSYTLYHLHQKDFHLEATAGYTYQHAVDVTDPAGKTYGHQIPYTPRHSGNASLLLTTPWVTLGYTVTLVGVRYSREQNIASTWMEPYADHGVTLSRDFRLGHATLRLKGQVLNLFNTQYEVVRSYPMMGRNYRISLTIES